LLGRVVVGPFNGSPPSTDHMHQLIPSPKARGLLGEMDGSIVWWWGWAIVLRVVRTAAAN
jgi:hypothetical protein